MKIPQTETTENPFQFMEEITAVIIEDVEHDIIALEIILKQQFPFVRIVGKAQSYQSGIDLIMYKKPMVAFMDIKLGGDLESFDVINEVYQKGFKEFVPIFITGWGSDDYRARAIEFAGGQYFTKPMDSEKMQEALRETFKQLLRNTFDYDVNVQRFMQMIQQLKAGLTPKKDYIKNHLNEEVIIDLTKLKYLEADGAKSHFYFENGETVCSNRHLKFFEDRYKDSEEPTFFRIHRQTLVNLDFMDSFSQTRGILKLKTGEKLAVSQREGKELKRFLNENDFGNNGGWWNRLF
jgi:DNA-binding LytR/AlgR family response regulator